MDSEKREKKRKYDKARYEVLRDLATIHREEYLEMMEKRLGYVPDESHANNKPRGY